MLEVHAALLILLAQPPDCVLTRQFALTLTMRVAAAGTCGLDHPRTLLNG